MRSLPLRPKIRASIRRVIAQQAVWVVLILTLTAIPAKAQLVDVASLLRTIEVRIDVTNTTTGKGGLCHGFVSTVANQRAYIATAKHCLELSSVPLRPNLSYGQMNLSILITYSNGDSGKVVRTSWANKSDAAVFVATYSKYPPSFHDNCVLCRVQTGFSPGTRFQVLSLLSAAGGPTEISSGEVIGEPGGHYVLLLPAACGTSGSPVLNSNDGTLVGIVVAGPVHPDSCAGFRAEVVLGGDVDVLVWDSVIFDRR